MQFIDLDCQQKRIRPDLENRISAVLDHGQYIMGPEINKLELKLAEFVGVKHAISCASGTDALLLSLMALGVGPGDAVFTSPFTFIATAEVIQLLGAVPVFVDIQPGSFNIDPNKLSEAITAIVDQNETGHPVPRTKFKQLRPQAAIIVDLFGLPAEYNAISQVVSDSGLFCVEDAAQSLGAKYKGLKTCSFGDVGCTSFFPAKPLGCYGDGGMCFTDNERIASIMKSLRVHGKGDDKYDNIRIGLNGRMDTIQAAVLLSKFSIFPEEISLRRRVAQRYTDLLEGVDGLVTPVVPTGSESVWAQYSVLASSGNKRQRLQDHLKNAGIPSAIYYPKPLHLQTAFLNLRYRKGDFPVSEDLSQRIFSLPMHPYLTLEEQETIAAVIRSVS